MVGKDSLQQAATSVQRPVSSKVLAVGDLFPVDAIGPGAPARDISSLAFEDVTPAALARLEPDIVLSPLVGPGFDCFDLAGVLADAGFRGLYRAVAPAVPNPGLVRREIADLFPDLDFDLLLLEPPG